MTNPFRNYLTPDKFPGQLRNTATVTLGSLLVPYPQYGKITQTNTNGKKLNTQTVELRAQRPFNNGFSVLVAYAWNHERVQQRFDDIANYQVLQTNGEEGWEWRPTDTPVHRLTTAFTWQIPVGRGQAVGTDWNAAVDAVLGNWQYTASGRFYSGRPVFFNTSYVVSGNPKLSNPTRDKWFDTSMFAVQDTFTPRSNPYLLRGAERPVGAVYRHDADQVVQHGLEVPPQARIEAYNVFDAIVWDQPEVNLASANFGKVTRKRVDSHGPRDPAGRSFRVLSHRRHRKRRTRANASSFVRTARRGSLAGFPVHRPACAQSRRRAANRLSRPRGQVARPRRRAASTSSKAFVTAPTPAGAVFFRRSLPSRGPACATRSNSVRSRRSPRLAGGRSAKTASISMSGRRALRDNASAR